MKYSHILMATVLTVFICLTLQAQHQHRQETQIQVSQQAAKDVYSCPMHPEVVSDKPGECPRCGMQLEKQSGGSESSPSDMMGKPTFEQTTQGLNIRVWLITQTEHKQMMKDHGMMGGEMKKHHDSMGAMHGNTGEEKDHQMMDDQMQPDGKGMNEEMTALMLVGTHHIMVVVEDEATKTDRENSEVEVQAVSPTGERATVTLTRMMKHFSGGLTLTESGQYSITVVVRGAQRVVPVGFAFEVRSIND